MNHPPTKSSLSPNRQRLVETMQQLNFGRIEKLHVAAGEPSFSPPPRLVQDIKFGTPESALQPGIGREDFVLRSSVIELFRKLEQLGTGVVSAVEIRHGLPARLILERTVEESPL